MSRATVVLLTLVLAGVTAGRAEARMGLALNAGQATVKGDLTKEKEDTAVVGGISFLGFLGPRGASTGALLDLDFGLFGRYDEAGDKFPFEEGKELVVDMSSLSLGPCFLTDAYLSLCPAVGYAQVEVRQGDDYLQNYAGTLFGLYAGRMFGEGLLAYMRVNGVGISQRVDGERSGFTLIHVLLAVGWAFDWEE